MIGDLGADTVHADDMVVDHVVLVALSLNSMSVSLSWLGYT